MTRKTKRAKEKNLRDFTAEDLMQTDPVTYHPDMTVQQIAAVLVKKKYGAVTIVDGAGKPVGIVTEYDVLRAIQQGKDLKKSTPSEIMTEPLIVSEKTPLAEVLDALVTGHLIHIPVVDHEEKLVGLIERHEVLVALTSTDHL